MTLKQRLCGFRGHKSIPHYAWTGNKCSHIQLRCSVCDFTTKWFETWEKDKYDAAWQDAADRLQGRK